LFVVSTNIDVFKKKTKASRVVQVVELLPGKHEAMTSNPSATKTKPRNHYFVFFFSFGGGVPLGTEPKASHRLGKCSTTELCPQS
jgi:hypothetical protein